MLSYSLDTSYVAPPSLAHPKKRNSKQNTNRLPPLPLKRDSEYSKACPPGREHKTA